MRRAKLFDRGFNVVIRAVGRGAGRARGASSGLPDQRRKRACTLNVVTFRSQMAVVEALKRH